MWNSRLRNHRQPRTIKGPAGFTLLEVLISIAILAVVLTAVLRLEKQSIDMGAIQKDVVIAGLLAQNKMAEIELEGFPVVGESEGDFGEDYLEYVWKSETEETYFEGVNQLKLTVFRQIGKDDPVEIISITKFFVDPDATVKLREEFDPTAFEDTEEAIEEAGKILEESGKEENQ
jgi:general secretion pathway protein I